MCVCVVECERERVGVHVLGVYVEGFTERLEEHICLQDGNLGERFHIQGLFFLTRNDSLSL